MSEFSVFVLTAPPPGQSGETSGPFVKLDGREALVRSVELFLNRDNIKQVVVVVSAESQEEIRAKFGGALSFMGVKLLVGGKKWQEQIAAGAGKIASEATHVLIHDAARPIVPYSDIDALLEAAEKHAAVSLASPVRATLAEIDEGGAVMALHSPAAYMQVLSPQALTRQRFLEWAGGRPLHPSELALVKASGLNMRLGSAADATLARAMLNLAPKPKSKAPSNPFEEAQW